MLERPKEMNVDRCAKAVVARSRLPRKGVCSCESQLFVNPVLNVRSSRLFNSTSVSRALPVLLCRRVGIFDPLSLFPPDLSRADMPLHHIHECAEQSARVAIFFHPGNLQELRQRPVLARAHGCPPVFNASPLILRSDRRNHMTDLKRSRTVRFSCLVAAFTRKNVY